VVTSGGIVGIARHAEAARQIVCGAAAALRPISVVAVTVARYSWAGWLVSTSLAVFLERVSAIT